MRQIEDELTFRELQRAERAVLLLHARWSMPSVMALTVVEKWAQQWESKPGCPSVAVFTAPTMPQDYCVSIQRWLDDYKALLIRGAGEVFWLEAGRIVATVPCGITAEELERRTLELWNTR